MKRCGVIGMLLVAILFQSAPAVGALFARRPLSNDSMKTLWLTNYNADVTITDQIAVTHVDQTFKNETAQQLEGIFVFPLPANAIVTELALWINGIRTVASVKDRDTARHIFDSLIRPRVDPALLEYMGNNSFQLRVFPIDPSGIHQERRIEITYAELLPYALSQVEYRFFLKTTGASPKPPQRFFLSYALTTQKKILALNSPTHEGSAGYYVTKKSDTSYEGIFGNENAYSDKDFRIVYKLESDGYALNNLTYVPKPGTPEAMFFDSTGDDPYYVLWITTPDTVKVLKKNVVFIADISSSMAGTRIVQLKNALTSMVNLLNAGDRFNIVVFSSSVRSFKENLVTADAATKAAATEFVNQLTEIGLTNMEDAFKLGFAAAWSDSAVNSAVFLTDGKPTWPVSSTPQSVRDTVKTYNKAGIAVYSFGIGEEIDETFLRALAKENNGTYTGIAADDSIASIMTSFMKMISYPLIKNCAISYSGLATSEVLPNPLPNLLATAQLTVLGRYKGTGSWDVIFSGKTGSSPVTLTQRLSFPQSETNHAFIPRMWASAKINELLDQIALYGERPELKDAVKKLGIKYGLVTPYTSLIAVENTGVKPGRVIEDKTKKAAVRMHLAANVPNPVVMSTMLRYSIPSHALPQRVSLKIYDVRGRLVRNLVDEMTLGGNFFVKWDALDVQGKRVTAGLYFAVLEAAGSRTMIQMRVL
ncbi:MAG: VWA domain-containing protein [Chitinispirillaceae bacterium]|nr:VWA domain-containing protein [Chitinispirillaceae bacterium]